MKLLTMSLLVLALAGTVRADEPPHLSDADIVAALQAGQQKGPHGLHLAEFTMSGTSGYSLMVYSPQAWLRSLAAKAKAEFRTLTPSDITDEMRRNVWRVQAFPNTPTKYDRNSMVFASSVDHVVIRNEKATTVVQPLAKEPFDETVGNALGAKLTFVGQLATFPAADVLELWGSQRDQEFVISVVGPNWKHNFTVKKKHFERLQ